MALQAGLATSKILLILGASIGTSILVQNGTLSDFLGDTYKVLVKHLRHDIKHSKQSSADPNLLAQLTRLRKEVSSLSSERSSITLVSGSSRSYGSLINAAVPALLIGAAGYGYMRLKGLCLADLMYVTRHSMSNAVSSVSKQVEQVSSEVTAAKRHLNSRLEHLSGNADQNSELQAELRNEVSVVREDVEKYGLEIETVQRLVQNLGVKIGTIESKQDLANMGVVYLCNFVEKAQTAESPELIQGAQRPRLERSAAGSIGLKDLQSISNLLESADANAKISSSTSTEITVSGTKSSNTATTSNTKGSSPGLQRRFTTSFAAGFTRSCLSRT